MKETPAWLLNIGAGRVVGTGEREMLHLVEQPELFDVPLAPRHCGRVLAWQGQLLPVWDILAWMEPGNVIVQTPLVGIVGYQTRRGEMPRFGGLILASAPVRIRVDDSQACALPVDQQALHEIALSCFMQDNRAVPILNLSRMFTRFLVPPVSYQLAG